MEASESKKLALIYILEILKSDTDADHPLYQEEIAELLEGIECRGNTSCPDQLSKAIRAYHD